MSEEGGLGGGANNACGIIRRTFELLLFGFKAPFGQAVPGFQPAYCFPLSLLRE